jgi:hypothetical protein
LYQVYELVGSRWVDQGTAFCFGQFQEDTNEAFLVARAEMNYHNVILSTPIRTNDVYQQQAGACHIAHPVYFSVGSACMHLKLCRSVATGDLDRNAHIYALIQKP